MNMSNSHLLAASMLKRSQRRISIDVPSYQFNDTEQDELYDHKPTPKLFEPTNEKTKPEIIVNISKFTNEDMNWNVSSNDMAIKKAVLTDSEYCKCSYPELHNFFASKKATKDQTDDLTKDYQEKYNINKFTRLKNNESKYFLSNETDNFNSSVYDKNPKKARRMNRSMTFSNIKSMGNVKRKESNDSPAKTSIKSYFMHKSTVQGINPVSTENNDKKTLDFISKYEKKLKKDTIKDKQKGYKLCSVFIRSNSYVSLVSNSPAKIPTGKKPLLQPLIQRTQDKDNITFAS